ncbi:foldase protein PrsA [Pseudobutyrivibrio sp. YE44]|uniref:peptidyl-prolyl cis-trans isomerase n=1 Tax=Pseudobutyrivibrio sp. YE44 TaxID=1520802 RepID=UPI00087EA312|nr:peptidyl-prolyl cis-trans isomerase [Pseudobutyrivibrio sp. YE44]SDB28488.1 foldase protein PrsA [Pseudobutyrivibrio sp. YE44]
MNNTRLKSAGIAALSAAVLFTGCGKLDSDATLVTIKNGDATDTISLGYANFAARYQQSMYDQFLLGYYGEDMWSQDMSGKGSTLEEETKDGVLTELEEQYLAKCHTRDYKIKLSEDQEKAIDEAAKKFMSDNSKETIEAMGATEEYVKQYLESRTYYTYVSNAAKEQLGADITEDDCWMRTFTYAVFETTGKKDEEGNVTEYTEDEIANLKKDAEELAAAKDFTAQAEKLGVTTTPYSYLKGETEDSTVDMSIITAAEALKEGEVSAVIEVDGVGYYVLKLDKDHDEDASTNKKESLESEAFTKLMDKWKESITWKVDEELWKEVKFDTLFKAVEKEETEEPAEETTTEETTEKKTEETTSEESTEAESEEKTEDKTEEKTEESTEDSEQTEDASEESDAN